MIATWMLYATVVAILAGLGALALERGARLLGRAGRWCWVGAMLVTLMLPVVAWMYPLHPAPAIAPTPQAGTAVALNGHVDLVVPVGGAPTTTPFDWSVFDRPLAYGWALCSLALLGWFAFGTWRLARMRKLWRWNGDLFVSNDVGPAVIGFFRCQVVVPEWSLALSQEQRDLLLAHEAEHLSAHDPRLLLVSAAVLALVPWNPGVWWQFRRLRLAIELDCDERVLRVHPDRARYGRLLLDVGARAARTLMPVTAFHEPMSSLERRILSMTAQRPERARWIAAGAAVGAAVAVFFACEAPRPTAPISRDGLAGQAIIEGGKDSVTVPPWVSEAMERYYPELASGKGAAPTEVWFIADGEHHVLRSALVEPHAIPGTSLGLTHNVSTVFPGLHSGIIQSITPGGTQGWAKDNLRVVWVTVVDSASARSMREPIEQNVDSIIDAEKARLGSREEPVRNPRGTSDEVPTPLQWLWTSEGNRAVVEVPSRGAMLEKGTVVVADKYPQYLNQPADPPVTVWVVEGADGRILSTHVSKAYERVGDAELTAEVPQYRQFRPGEWMSWLPLSEQRTDVRVVWVHSNRGS